ncbi:MAG: restriction endonuclease subunit S [Acidimicrobiales bacterium]|nr:restriction endonuclease subunit S [Acidimicrobiales bacterium]
MTTLLEVCELIVDSEHKTAPKSEAGFPLVRTTDIGRGRLDLSNVQRVDKATYDQWTRRAVPVEGDLILAREAPVGNVAVVTEGIRPVLGQRTVLIRPDDSQVDSTYLCYRLLGADVQHWMNAVANGATVPHLNMSDIRELPLGELPEMELQGRIGTALADIDDLIENNRRRIEILEEMARLLYREWFVHYRFPGHEDVELIDSELGPIPEGWKVTSLQEESNLLKSNVKPQDFPDEDFAHFSIPALDEAHHPAIEPGADIKSGKYLVRQESVLLSKLNPRFPRVWRVTPPTSTRSIASTEFLVIEDNGGWPLPFLYGVCSSDSLSGRLTAMAGGTSTSHQRVKPGDVVALPLVGPSTEVVDRYSTIATPMLDLADNLRDQNKTLTAARDLLLPRLVSGELDVSEIDLELEAVG